MTRKVMWAIKAISYTAGVWLACILFSALMGFFIKKLNLDGGYSWMIISFIILLPFGISQYFKEKEKDVEIAKKY